MPTKYIPCKYKYMRYYKGCGYTKKDTNKATVLNNYNPGSRIELLKTRLANCYSKGPNTILNLKVNKQFGTNINVGNVPYNGKFISYSIQ